MSSPMFCSLLLIFAVVCASGEDPPQQDFHINVGTSLALGEINNIVLDDKTTSSYTYNPDTPGSVPLQSFPSEDDTTQFWVTTTMQDSKLVMQEPTITVDAVKSEAENKLKADVVGWGKNPIRLIPPPPPTASGKPKKPMGLSFTIQYSCFDTETYRITVSLRILNIAKPRAPTDYLFSFHKSCAMTAPEHGTALKGFIVGSAPEKNDVIIDGESTEAYSASADEEKMNVVGGEDDFATFWFQYHPEGEPTTTFTDAKATAESEDVVMAETFGPLASGSHNLEMSTALIIKFICRAAGKSLVTVTMTSPEKPDILIKFSFFKQCDDARRVEGVFTPGLNIYQGNVEVVKDGVTATEYLPALTEKDEALILKRESVEEASVAFTIRLEDTNNPDDVQSVRFRRPVLVGTSLGSDQKKIADASLSGTLLSVNEIERGDRPLTLKIALHCRTKGTTIVTVEIPLIPTGVLIFAFPKHCNSESTPEQIEAPEKIKGLGIGRSRGGSDVVKNGLPLPEYNASDNAQELEVIDTDDIYVSFYINLKRAKSDADKSTKDPAVKFGTPELLSSIDLSHPIIGGRGADGGIVLLRADSTFTITFHCLSKGKTLVTIYIPILEPTEEEQEEYDFKTRSEPIEFSFWKICDAPGRQEIAQIGGIYIEGLNIGTKEGGHDVVWNGIPKPAFLQQRRRSSTSSPNVLDDVDVQRLFLSYTPGENSAIELEPARVFEHRSVAQPQFSGSLARGGIVNKDDKLEGDITFNCRYEAQAAIIVSIPVRPSGEITFTVTKKCLGESHPMAKVFPGLNVYLDDTTMIINDGVVQSEFSSFNSETLSKHWTSQNEYDSFWISRAGDEVLTSLDPVALCHRPVCVAQVIHDMKRPEVAVANPDAMTVAEVEAKRAASMEVQILNTPQNLTVIYHCIRGGKSLVTLHWRLVEDSSVIAWTWFVQCPEAQLDLGWGEDYFGDDDFALDSPMGTPTGDSGVDPTYPPSQVNPTNPSKTDTSSGDGVDPKLDFDEEPDEDFDEWSYGTYYDEDDEYYFGSVFEDAPSCLLNKCTTPIISVGTSPLDRTDVVQDGIPRFAYTTHCSVNNSQICAVVPPSKHSMTFWITCPARQEWGVPRVNATKRQGKVIAAPTLKGGAVDNRLVVPYASIDLTLEFNCVAKGVTHIQVIIPTKGFDEKNSDVAFSFLKTCAGESEQDESYMWTTNRVFAFLFLLVTSVAVGGALFCFKKKPSGQAEYALVGTKAPVNATPTAAELANEEYSRDRDSESD